MAQIPSQGCLAHNFGHTVHGHCVPGVHAALAGWTRLLDHRPSQRPSITVIFDPRVPGYKLLRLLKMTQSKEHCVSHNGLFVAPCRYFRLRREELVSFCLKQFSFLPKLRKLTGFQRHRSVSDSTLVLSQAKNLIILIWFEAFHTRNNFLSRFLFLYTANGL